jgi:hypothetical protein
MQIKRMEHTYRYIPKLAQERKSQHMTILTETVPPRPLRTPAPVIPGLMMRSDFYPSRRAPRARVPAAHWQTRTHWQHWQPESTVTAAMDSECRGKLERY